MTHPEDYDVVVVGSGYARQVLGMDAVLAHSTKDEGPSAMCSSVPRGQRRSQLEVPKEAGE